MLSRFVPGAPVRSVLAARTGTQDVVRAVVRLKSWEIVSSAGRVGEVTAWADDDVGATRAYTAPERLTERLRSADYTDFYRF